MKRPSSKDYEYFLEIWPELVKDHPGKFVAIKNRQVPGIFADYMEAARSVYAERKYGTVLMQNIGKGPEALAIYFHTPGVAPSQ